MAEDIGLFEAMYSQRAIRHIKSDPIPDELVEKIIDAAIRAPNGGNQQGWGFVVIKDRAVKEKMAPLYNDVGRPNHGAANTWSEKNSANSILGIPGTTPQIGSSSIASRPRSCIRAARPRRLSLLTAVPSA